jgi:malonyl-CoA O-methyltransferase
MDIEGPAIQRRWMRAAFDRAAARYEQAAALQREVAGRLVERLELIRIQPRLVAEVGCGTGYGVRALAARYRGASVYGVDIALGMVTEARRRAPRLFSRQHFACADAERLGLRTDCFELVFSNLTLQWCQNLTTALQELERICAPGGLVLFSTLGPDTLRELRDSWARVDGFSHVNTFQDMHVVGDALVAAGFRDVVMDVDRVTRHYPDVLSLMRDLKALGAHNVTTARPPGLTGRRRLAAVRANYESFRSAGGLPASYEVVYGHGWKAAAPGVAVPFKMPPASRA